MPGARWGTAVRGVALLGGCAAAGAGAWRLTRDLLRPVLHARPSDLADVPFDQGLGALMAAALLGSVLWLVLGTLLTLAAQLTTEVAPAHPVTGALSTLTRRGVPRSLRRWVVAVLGAAVTTGAVGPALARPTHPAAADSANGVCGDPAQGVAGLALPDRTTGPPSSAHATGHDAPVVTVRPGDSLWSITAHRLPPGSSDRDITAAWQRLHVANAGRIGPDPDLIVPGTRLDVPGLTAPDREDPS